MLLRHCGGSSQRYVGPVSLTYFVRLKTLYSMAFSLCLLILSSAGPVSGRQTTVRQQALASETARFLNPPDRIADSNNRNTTS